MGEASPRFRTDLLASATEADGIACIDVTDPQTGTKFRFYDFEYQLALQLNGQPLSAVTAWAAAAYDVELTTDGIAQFAGRLAELGFLEGTPAPVDVTDMGVGPGATTVAREVTDMGVGFGDRAPTPQPDDLGTGPTPILTPSEISDMSAGPTAVSRPAALSAGAGLDDDSGPEAIDSPEADWTAPQAIKTATFIPDSAMLAPSLDRTPVAPEIPFLEEGEPTPSPLGAASGDAAPARSPAASAATTPPPVSTPPAAPPVSVAVTRPSEAPTLRLSPSEKAIAFTRPADAPTIPSLPSAFTIGSTKTTGPASAGRASGATEAAPTPPPPTQPPAAGPGWAATLEGTLGNEAGGNAATSATPPPAPAAPLPPGAAPDRLGAAPPGLGERRQPPKPDAVVMSGFTTDELGAKLEAKKPGPGKVVVAVVLLAIVAAAVGYVVWSRSQSSEPHALKVRAFVPKPTAVYRWFPGRGVVVEDEPRTLAFESPGRLVELLPAGAEFGADEILGRLQGSAAIETLLAHHRSRLAFHEQMRDSMHAAGNAIEARQAELKRVEKQRLVADTAAALARVTLRSNEPGEVVETLAKVGTPIKPGAPVVRIKGRLLHGEFRLEADEAAAATQLAFCRVEVVGLGPHASNDEPRRPNDPVADAGPQGGPRFVDCGKPTRAGNKLTVALPSDVGLVPGQPLRLARQRLDAVFPVPAAAVQGEGDERAVWIAGRDGVAERRPVTLAGTDDGEAFVGGGLRVGDDVIVEPPAGLRAGARIVSER